MNLHSTLLLAYLTTPFFAAFYDLCGGTVGRFSGGMVASAARLLLLLVMIGMAFAGVGVIGKIAQDYSLELVATLHSYRYGFLLTAELSFFLAHWMCRKPEGNGGITGALIGFAQGVSMLFVISDNAVATGGLLILGGTLFYYLIRLSGADDEAGAAAARKMYTLYFFLAVIMIVWGISEFSSRDLRFSTRSGSSVGLLLWMFLMVFALPLPPWSRWFGYLLDRMPESAALTLVTFVSAVGMKCASFFSIVYPDLPARQKFLLYLLGVLGAIFSICGLFAADSRRRMLTKLPIFFFSLLLVALGVSKNSLVLSAYFISIFVPILTALILYASVMKIKTPLQKIFAAFLFAIILGIPGTPVFQIFSGIGARSLDMGVGYAVLFGLLWFFYFYANVHICQKIFIDEKALDASEGAELSDHSYAVVGYGLFLMVFVIAITQIAGGVL